jgi:hypothetical protein
MGVKRPEQQQDGRPDKAREHQEQYAGVRQDEHQRTRPSGESDPNRPRAHPADDEISGAEIAERIAEESERADQNAEPAAEETREGRQQTG